MKLTVAHQVDSGKPDNENTRERSYASPPSKSNEHRAHCRTCNTFEQLDNARSARYVCSVVCSCAVAGARPRTARGRSRLHHMSLTVCVSDALLLHVIAVTARHRAKATLRRSNLELIASSARCCCAALQQLPITCNHAEPREGVVVLTRACWWHERNSSLLPSPKRSWKRSRRGSCRA